MLFAYGEREELKKEMQRKTDVLALAYGLVCEMYVNLHVHGRPPSLADIDALRRAIEDAMGYGGPFDEMTFRRVQGIE